MGGRKMYRYVVPVDDQAHVFTLTANPVVVAAATGPRSHIVEFWAENDEDPGWERWFQVFGTGHTLPAGAKWTGTCPRTALGLVWHLYEVNAPGGEG
jgi:hypothetical protein